MNNPHDYSIHNALYISPGIARMLMLCCYATCIAGNAMFNDMLSQKIFFSMQYTSGIKKPRLSKRGAFLNVCSHNNCYYKLPHANGVQTGIKTNEEKATCLPPGRTYYKKVWSRQTGVCLQYYLAMVKSDLPESTLTQACIGMDQVAKIKDLQMSFSRVYRRSVTTTFRLANYSRIV